MFYLNCFEVDLIHTEFKGKTVLITGTATRMA